MNKEILEKSYISASELKKITGFGMNTCREIIKEIENEMISKKLFIPPTKKKLVLTKLVIKKLGL